MYKETLPAKCPPPDIREYDHIVFRIIQEDTLKESDFFSYAKLFPNNIRYKNMCDAYAVSFFKTFEQTIATYKEAKIKRNNILGKFIAEIKLENNCGAGKFKESSGHYNIWLYSQFSFTQLIIRRIEKIDENR